MMTFGAATSGRSGWAVLGLVLGFTASAWAYLVGPAVSLDKMTELADLVVKARAVATQPTDDPWFKPLRGFAASATKLEVMSVLKGERGGGVITFQHYAVAAAGGGFSYMPQHYEFTPGKSYIVFAKKTDTPGVLRQLW